MHPEMVSSKSLGWYTHYCLLPYRDGQFRIPNPKDLNPKLSESNRIWLISCLQALSRCLFTDFLFVKVLFACNDSKTNLHTQTLIECVRFLMMHTRADIVRLHCNKLVLWLCFCCCKLVINAFILIVLIAKKDSDSGFGLTILE